MSTSYFFLKKLFRVAIFHTRFDVEFVDHPKFDDYMQAEKWAAEMIHAGSLPRSASAVELYVGT